MRAHAIAGPWPAGERVLVCVSEAANTSGLIVMLAASADPLTGAVDGDVCRDRRTERLRDVERDSAFAIICVWPTAWRFDDHDPGRNDRDEGLAYARENNITQIASRQIRTGGWFEMIHGSSGTLGAGAPPISVSNLGGSTRTGPEKSGGDAGADRTVPAVALYREHGGGSSGALFSAC